MNYNIGLQQTWCQATLLCPWKVPGVPPPVIEIDTFFIGVLPNCYFTSMQEYRELKKVGMDTLVYGLRKLIYTSTTAHQNQRRFVNTVSEFKLVWYINFMYGYVLFTRVKVQLKVKLKKMQFKRAGRQNFFLSA